MVSPKVSSPESPPSKRQTRIPSLLTWAQQVAQIQLSPTLKLQTANNNNKNAGLGFTATQAISGDQVLLQVPCDVALTVGTGPNDGGRLERACRKAATRPFRLETLPWYVQFSLYLHMLKPTDKNNEKEDSNNGLDRTPWLQSLPTQYDTPLHWTESQRTEWLQYDAMVQAVNRQDTAWKQYYQTVSGAFPTLSYDEFCWGCETARSRAFSSSSAGRFDAKIYAFTLLLIAAYVGLGLGSLEQAANGAGVVVSATILKDFVWPKLFDKKKVYVICPVIDMANHNSLQANAQVSLEYFANAYSLATSKSAGVIPQGQAVEISYGARSNDQLLQYYGFVEADNPHDVYLMPALRDWPLEAMEQASGRTVEAGRLEKLARAGLLGSSIVSTDDEDDNHNVNSSSSSKNSSGADKDTISNPLGGVVITRTQGIDPAIRSALRALFSTPTEWEAAGQAVGNFALAVSPENEQAVQVAAKCALEWELQTKPTTLRQDREQLERLTNSGSGGGGKQKSLEDKLMEKDELLALQFRVEKKQLLADVIATL